MVLYQEISISGRILKKESAHFYSLGPLTDQLQLTFVSGMRLFGSNHLFTIHIEINLLRKIYGRWVKSQTRAGEKIFDVIA